MSKVSRLLLAQKSRRFCHAADLSVRSTTQRMYFGNMQAIEERFKRATGLPDRSQYKIFYCPLRAAPILTLGINPGGSPSQTSRDGTIGANGARAAASASYYESGEHDILDCHWRENHGLIKILAPLLGGDAERIRTEVVKTNLAFRRSKKRSDINLEKAIAESAPFLREIVAIVEPSLIVLTGVQLHRLGDALGTLIDPLVPEERDPRIKQIVFAAGSARLSQKGQSAVVVQIAHASQFSWTYDRYNVAAKIRKHWCT